MERRLKKWDIVKIKEPTTKDLPEGIVCKKTAQGNWKVSITDRPGQIKQFYINKQTIGLNMVVNDSLDYLKHPVCKITALTVKDATHISKYKIASVYIPTIFLSKPTKRVVDSRDLNATSFNTFMYTQYNKEHWRNLSSKTKDETLANNTPSDMEGIKKRKQIFFPKNRMTMKEIMLNLIYYTNSTATNFSSIHCPKCGAFVSYVHVASTRYIRKDGAITCKCQQCNKASFLSFIYNYNNKLIFQLTEEKL